MSGVEITTYVRLDGRFIPITDVDSHDGSCDYLPGAIRFAVDGVELLGVDLWDDVNWLWPLVIQMLDDYKRTGAGKRFFPDQPIAMTAAEAAWPGYTQVAVFTSDKLINRTVVAPRQELFDTVALAGLEFFQHLRRLCGAGSVQEQDKEVLEHWIDAAT